MRRFLILVFLLCVLGFLVYDSVIAVPDGSVGVITFQRSRLGPISTRPRTLDPGLHLSLPLLTRLQLYNTRVQMLVLNATVGDGTTFRLTAQVRLDPDSAVEVHQRLGPNYLQDQISKTVTALIENEIYDKTGGNLVSAESQQKLLNAVGVTLARDGFYVDQAILTRLDRMEIREETHADDRESDTDEDTD